MRLIVLLGLVSLFSDITYEGARGILGPYLGLLGASALAVGFVAGLGELLGYGLRLLSGWFADKSRAHWSVAAVGYVVNLLSVPTLALTGSWHQAAVLVALERTGKAIRTPSRDTILSCAASGGRRGLGFGIHEALDQIGAVIGPLAVGWVMKLGGSYRDAFALLGIPAVLALFALWTARRSYPHAIEPEGRDALRTEKGFPKGFWLYMIPMGLIGAGFPDFALIGYHLGKTAIVPVHLIPYLYALAMGVDALCALAFGWLFDKKGVKVMALSAVGSALCLPLAFSHNTGLLALGVVLWGMGMGVIDSVAKAVVAELLPFEKRGTGYGIFYTAFGLSWFLGSLLLGALYKEVSPGAAALCSLGLIAASVPLLLWLKDITPRP